jgi:hypothetical protein
MDVATKEVAPTPKSTDTMRALVFRGPNQIARDPALRHPRLWFINPFDVFLERPKSNAARNNKIAP